MTGTMNVAPPWMHMQEVPDPTFPNLTRIRLLGQRLYRCANITPRLIMKTPTMTVPMPRYPNGPIDKSSIAASNGIDINESSMTGPCGFGDGNDIDRVGSGDGDDLYE